MNRREFITLLGGVAAAWPLAARAQQPNRRIGMLIGYSENDPEIQARLVACLRHRERSARDYGFITRSADTATKPHR